MFLPPQDCTVEDERTRLEMKISSKLNRATVRMSWSAMGTGTTWGKRKKMKKRRRRKIIKENNKDWSAK